jgi:quercetin dioxygenase-like cupin family protein
MSIGFRSGSRRACGIAIAVAAYSITLLATPGMGYLFNYFSRATYVASMIHEGAHLPGWNAQIDVEGDTDVVQQDVALAPGGFSGWHSHPGPVFITVKTGTATFYNADDPTCSPVTYPAGSAFIEPAGVHHFLLNAGSTNLELLDTYLVPKGMATRQEQLPPPQCPF